MASVKSCLWCLVNAGDKRVFAVSRRLIGISAQVSVIVFLLTDMGKGMLDSL